MSDELREALAAYAHEAWSGWMMYLFGKGERGADGTWIMPKWAFDRWLRQATALYSELPESEKDSDRAEADKMLAIVQQYDARRWPEPTDEAAEQLLRAMWEVGQERLRTLGIALIDWGDREEPLREAAIEYAVAALRRLREQEGGEDGK